MKSSVIQVDPEILSGTPTFQGTRVPIKNFIDYLEGGETIEAFLDDFPTVSRKQVITYLEESSRAAIETVTAWVCEFCSTNVFPVS